MVIDIVRAIVGYQKELVGPMAIDQANLVQGLKVSGNLLEVSIDGEGKLVLEKLVKQYEGLFGRASVEVCREAVKSVLDRISPDDLPAVLR